jgi:hypothetical protein
MNPSVRRPKAENVQLKARLTGPLVVDSERNPDWMDAPIIILLPQ